MITEEKTRIFNALDRCDQCGAQAYVLVKGDSGELLFCSHHYNKIIDSPEGYDKMMGFMKEIVDSRELLNQ